MPILGFYLIRESLNPGYLSAVVKNEWGGRFLSTIENHDHSSFYYFDNFIDFQLKEWYIFVPAGIVTGLLSNDKKLASLALFILVIVFAYFILISLSQTKLEWYDVPMYPFIAIFIAFFIWIVANILKNTSAVTDHLNSKLVPALLCFFICLGPYRNIVHKTYKPEEYAWDKEFYEIGYYLKKELKPRWVLIIPNCSMTVIMPRSNFIFIFCRIKELISNYQAGTIYTLVILSLRISNMSRVTLQTIIRTLFFTLRDKSITILYWADNNSIPS